MSDFMDGDLFPDRPDHPDFWRLSESVLKQDGKFSEGNEPFETVMAQMVDVESIVYMADQRADFLLDKTGAPKTLMLKGLLMSMYLDGFTTGVGFTQAGGTRQA
jgi:hypothetical protein